MNKINKVPHSHTGNYSIKANHKIVCFIKELVHGIFVNCMNIYCCSYFNKALDSQ